MISVQMYFLIKIKTEFVKTMELEKKAISQGSKNVHFVKFGINSLLLDFKQLLVLFDQIEQNPEKLKQEKTASKINRKIRGIWKNRVDLVRL